MMGWVYVISHVRNISTDKSVSQQLRKARRIVRFGLSVRSQLRTCISPPIFLQIVEAILSVYVYTSKPLGAGPGHLLPKWRMSSAFGAEFVDFCL